MHGNFPGKNRQRDNGLFLTRLHDDWLRFCCPEIRGWDDRACLRLSLNWQFPFLEKSTKHVLFSSAQEGRGGGGFENIYETKLSKYETKLLKYETKLSKYETKLLKYETKLSKYETKLSKYETKLSKYETKLSKYETKLSKYERGGGGWWGEITLSCFHECLSFYKLGIIRM